MGLDILAFAWSIDAFQSVYGCRDNALYEKIIHSDNSSIRHYLHLEEGSNTDAVKALWEIFDGKKLKKFGSSTYAYALIGYLYEVGTYLGSNGGSYGREMDVQNALGKFGETTDALPSMDIAWPVGNIRVTDWPMYQGFLAPDVVRHAHTMQDIMTRVTYERMSHLRDSAYCFLEDLTKFYVQCAERGQDLILVAH